MLDFKPQTQLLSQQDSQGGGAQKCPVRVGGDFMLVDSSISCTQWQMFRIILAIKTEQNLITGIDWLLFWLSSSNNQLHLIY